MPHSHYITHYSKSTFMKPVNLWFARLARNIHISRQYSNCDSMKALNKVRRFSKERNLDNLVRALNFL